MAGETAGGPPSTATVGALRSIEEWDDIPKRLLEAIFEGMAKEPSKWIVMGLGFYLGYKGFDVFKWFVDTIGHAGSDIGETILDSAIDMAKVPFLPALSPVTLLLSLFGPITGALSAPTEPEDAAAPTAPVTSDDIVNDSDKGNLDLWSHEFEMKMISGAFGALTAISITSGGLGEIIKGIGMIVPESIL